MNIKLGLWAILPSCESLGSKIMSKWSKLIFFVAALAFGPPGIDAASAQATRTWVSGVGDDANPCSRTAPCKTFAGAISKTAAGGEINALDPGGFGAVTITKSITILADGAVGGVLASGVNGVLVNVAAGDKVVLKGLDIEGIGAGLNGVRMIGGGSLVIADSIIRGFRAGTGYGVDVQATDGARVTITQSQILNNIGGVNVKPASGTNNVIVDRSIIEGNSSFAVQGDGAGAAISLNASTLTGSPKAISALNFGRTQSYGNNVMQGTGAPTATIHLK